MGFETTDSTVAVTARHPTAILHESNYGDRSDFSERSYYLARFAAPNFPSSFVLYFDFNRTTPLAPSVLESMQPYWSTHFLLPGQEHAGAFAVGEALESARECIAALAGCESFEIVFTSGGTEANNLAILGLLGAADPGHVLVSQLEHESVLGPLSGLPSRDPGWTIETIPCDATGVIDPRVVESMLRANTPTGLPARGKCNCRHDPTGA